MQNNVNQFNKNIIIEKKKTRYYWIHVKLLCKSFSLQLFIEYRGNENLLFLRHEIWRNMQFIRSVFVLKNRKVRAKWFSR